MSKTRTFLSIGEVLRELKEEFPDISISKIRFLESEGLIDPSRTGSGYRKFYSADIAKLKYILRLQRDHYMPLKVIRDRLDHFDPSDPDAALPSSPAAKPAAVQRKAASNGAAETKAPQVATTEEDDDFSRPSTGMSLTFEELVNASGLSSSDVRELEEFGLIDPHQAGDASIYDEDDLLIAKIAKDFAKYGIDARHLRMYRNFADRESGLFEQVLIPRSASADGRRQVAQSITELAKLSKRLKHLLLKARLREHLRA